MLGLARAARAYARSAVSLRERLRSPDKARSAFSSTPPTRALPRSTGPVLASARFVCQERASARSKARSARHLPARRAIPILPYRRGIACAIGLTRRGIGVSSPRPSSRPRRSVPPALVLASAAFGLPGQRLPRCALKSRAVRIQALPVGWIAAAGGITVAVFRFVFIERWLYVGGGQVQYLKLDPLPAGLESAAEGVVAAAMIWATLELAVWLHRRRH